MLSVNATLNTESVRMICGTLTLRNMGTDNSAQYASLDALSALISSEAFHSTTAGGQLKIIVPALVQILALSSVPLQTLQSKYPTLSSPPPSFPPLHQY